jgi:hypothetical protein
MNRNSFNEMKEEIRELRDLTMKLTAKLALAEAPPPKAKPKARAKKDK